MSLDYKRGPCLSLEFHFHRGREASKATAGDQSCQDVLTALHLSHRPHRKGLTHGYLSLSGTCKHLAADGREDRSLSVGPED